MVGLKLRVQTTTQKFKLISCFMVCFSRNIDEIKDMYDGVVTRMRTIRDEIKAFFYYYSFGSRIDFKLLSL